MPITIRNDVVYTLLNSIQSQQGGNQDSHLSELGELGLSTAELLGHLDYLNQEGYVKASFSGDAYADKGPNPLPAKIAIQSASLTAKGQTLWDEMKTFPPKLIQAQKVQESVRASIPEMDRPFLVKVQTQAGLPDLYDARDFTVTVFRTMRDLMTTAQSDQVARELHTEAVPARDPNLSQEVSDLWQDTNPLVAFLSRNRPPFANSGPLGITDERFIRRIYEEGGLPRGVSTEKALEAVFAATKDELSPDRIAEISRVLPTNVQQLWDRARN